MRSKFKVTCTFGALVTEMYILAFNLAHATRIAGRTALYAAYADSITVEYAS